MQEKQAKIEINDLKESYTFGKMARQSNGSVLYRQGKAVLLATVVADSQAVKESFLPLTVQYIEKAYAAAKIPGGFIKRESKPSDFETLTSRIIDRSLRPLFPEGFALPVVITVLVLSNDDEVDLQVAALHAANAALLLSDLPVRNSIAALRIGRAEGELLFNPSPKELEKGSLDLLLVGEGDDISMVEMAVRATEVLETEEIEEIPPEALMGPIPVALPRHEINELSEEELAATIREAVARIEEACKEYERTFLPMKREGSWSDSNLFYTPSERAQELLEDQLGAQIDAALEGLSKSERGLAFEKIRHQAETVLREYGLHAELEESTAILDGLIGKRIRRQILEQGSRADGRRLNEVRPLTIESNLLPSVHGSCLFTRGETQVLATVTLGEAKEGQIYELLGDRSPRTERFMVHYNFPGFSVGEARPIGAPSRRELGHGNLAKRALEPVLGRDSSRTIRLVAEVLESNGSSSMATVCGGALALCAAEVEVKELVAGVAMGMVREQENSAVLTDIMGLEDHYGDMDFKIAGTRHGITALQMDSKSGGLDLDLLEETLQQARQARLMILEKMEEARKMIEPSGALPVSEHFSIDPSKIVHIIGKAGSTIREIIHRFEVSIDLDREKGGVKVTGHEKEKVLAAKEHINEIATNAQTREFPRYEAGKHYKGKVKRVVDYGIFVEMPGAYDALLHISKISKERVQNLQERYREGDEIDVVVLEQKGRKVELATPEYLED